MIGRLIVSAVVLIAATVLWRSAGVARALADEHERLATLRDLPADSTEPGGARLANIVDHDAHQHRAVADYWQRRYGASPTGSTTRNADRDPRLMLMAANATFRAARRNAAAAAAAVAPLDEAMQAYAAVLKESGFDRDAAYNYEFVARLRDRAAREKQPRTAAKPAGAAPAAQSDLPPGPTIHGRPGEHPPTTRGNEFEVLTPMDYGDREAQPEQTPGKKIMKKG